MGGSWAGWARMRAMQASRHSKWPMIGTSDTVVGVGQPLAPGDDGVDRRVVRLHHAEGVPRRLVGRALAGPGDAADRGSRRRSRSASL